MVHAAFTPSLFYSHFSTQLLKKDTVTVLQKNFFLIYVDTVEM